MSEQTFDFFDRVPERTVSNEPTDLKDRPWTEAQWLLTHPSTALTTTLTDEAKLIWEEIDGEKTVRDLLAESFEKGGSPVDIESLLNDLEKKGFVAWKNGHSTSDDDADRVDREMRRVLTGLLHAEWNLAGPASFFSRVGRSWGKLILSTNTIYLCCALGLVACYRLFVLFGEGEYTELRIGDSVLLGLVGLALWVLVLPIIAEMFFALGVPSLGLKIRQVLLRLRFGWPSIRVETEDPVSLAPGTFTRLLVARTAAYLGMAGIAILLTWSASSSFIVDALRQLAVVSLLLCFISLSPVLPTRAYRSLCAYLHVEHLRKLSFQYLGRELVHFFGKHKEETVHGKILLFFAFYTCVWVIAAVKLASVIFRSELPLLLSEALFEESQTALIVALIVLVIAAAGILAFVLGSIFFALWKMAHWVWMHLYPTGESHKVLVNIPVLAASSLVVWWVTGDVHSLLLRIVIPLVYVGSIAFFCSAVVRLTGSIWHLPVWGLTVAAALWGSSFIPAGLATGDAPELLRLGALVLTAAALVPIRYRIANLAADRILLGLVCVVALVGVILTSPLVLGLLVLFLVLNMSTRGRTGSLAPIWVSLGFSVLAFLMGVKGNGGVQPTAHFQVLMVLLSSVLWLNTSFGFRHLLAKVPGVFPAGTRRRAHSDLERLRAAFQNMRTLLRHALSVHLGEGFLRGMERTWGERIDAESSVEETEEISAMAVRLDNECQKLFHRVRRLIGRNLFPDLISDALHRIYWMEREVLVQHLPTVAATVDRDQEEAVDPQQLLVKLPLFSGLDEGHRKEVASLFRRRKVPEGAQVIAQGTPGSEFYVIANGTASVEVEDEWGQRRTVAHLADTDYFGEVALLQDVPRTATVVAQTPLDLFVLGRQDFRTHLTEVSTLSESIEVSVARVNMLRGIALFRRLPPALLSKIASWFEPVRVKAGDTVIEEGQPGEAFYVIQKGLCQVMHRRDEASEEELARLGPGEYFGEISLVLGRPTTATVRALEPTELLQLSKDRFLAIFRENTFFAENLSKVASRRLIDTRGREGR